MTLLLQSKDHGELLDVIDDLRSQGISRYVDLPQLVVCGDQSSGKSSVLEAVSGIPFPRKDNLCTRFATEVILRRFSESSTHVSIVPAPDRSEEDKKRLLEFQRHHVSLEEIESLIDEAKAIMRLDNEAGAFTHDVLRIEVSGPSQPHLTLVDLPGLFQASNKAQSDEDAEAVTSLVLTYMRKRRSIILAVVSAKNDFANQIVTRYARDLDPEGNRTLGIITKPDTLHAGSDSEKAFAELTENKDVTFRLGWHVVKNRDYDTRHTSAAERDEAEQQFFSQGIWATLPRRQVGVSSLKPRLSTLLRDQIMTEVSQLIDDVEAEVRECHAKLAKLGAPRSTVTDQRLYLLGISQKFTTLIQSAVDGVYSDHFFESATTDRGYRKRLRAVVQNHLLDFAKTMRQLGHAKHIMPHVTKKQRAANSRLITGDEFICQVLNLMQRSRGCELPGTYNPQIIRDLFFQQSEPWQSIVQQFAEEIWESSMSTANLILDYVSDEMTASALRNLIIGPVTDSIKEKVANTIGQIMHPHQTGHPITYNHYLTENIQKSRAEHQRKQMARKLDAFFGTDQEKGKNRCDARSIDVVNLLNTITCNSIADMDRYACSEAIDCMRAYYKVGSLHPVAKAISCARYSSAFDTHQQVFYPSRVLLLSRWPSRP
jgi:GTP-binding protein EngB required for normal cell division